MSSSTEKAKRSLHIELTLGSFFSITVTYLLNIPTSFLLCVSVLMPGSALFFLLMLPLIVLLYNYTLRLTAIWLLMSSGRAGTLARAHAKKLKPLSAPSNRLPSHGFLSQESPVNTVRFTTSPSPAPLPPRLPPSTALLIQTCTHVPGAPSTPYASPFLTSPRGPKQPSVMLLKHTVQSPSSLTNGQAWLSNCLMRMNLPSIHATILVSPQPEAFMVVSEMQHSTFSALRELVPAQNGLTTTFSSGFFVSPLLFSRHPFYLHLSGEHLAAYNLRRQVWHSTITLNGGRHQLGSRFWYQGESLPDDSPAEFDEDAACPLADHSSLPNRSDLDALFTYCDTDIDSISGQLGIPWEPSKTIPFSSSVPYLGFDWNLAERTVAITEKKKTKYGLAIKEWLPRPTHDLEEAQKLYGKLLHASLVLPAGRAYLTSLESLMASFSKNPFVPHHAPRHTAADLSWWLDALDSPRISRSIPGPAIVMDKHAFSDASSGFGIGVVIGSRWRAWRLIPGWKTDGRDIGWAEAVGFEFLARTLCATSNPGQHFRVFGDNKGVVEGWWKGRSRNWETNKVFRRIHDLADTHQCSFITRYIASRENPADKPSRGLYPPTNYLLPEISIPTALRQYIINFNC